jgi:hypothetical protein
MNQAKIVKKMDIKDVHEFHPKNVIKNTSNCMLCGEPLIYLTNNEMKTCTFCGNVFSANAVCKKNHYVCDTCHGADAYAFSKEFLTHTELADLVGTLNALRSHQSFNLHGPEHHYAIAGVIPAVYKNMGGNISNDDILTAMERATAIPGGSCGFWGGCGASLGAGIGFGVILGSNPLKPKRRQTLIKIVTEISGELAKVTAARCCQRECWTALKKASEISEKYIGISLPADENVICTQMDRNKECIKSACQFYHKQP